MRPNFYSGWRRSVMVMLVDIVVVFFGGDGGKDDEKIHPFIHHGTLAPSALIVCCGRKLLTSPISIADGAALRC